LIDVGFFSVLRYVFIFCLMRSSPINPTSVFGTRSKVTVRFFLGGESRLARQVVTQQRPSNCSEFATKEY
jgi:hypothetical protein